MPNLSFFAPAYDRKLLFNDGGNYKEITFPGGAALLARLLGVSAALPDSGAATHAQLVKSGDGYAFGDALGLSGEIKSVRIGDGDTTVVLDEGYGVCADIPDVKPVFWASDKCLPDIYTWNRVKRGAFLMLDADVLRHSGALISLQISWERTAADLLWQLRNNQRFAYLLGCKYIFVVFADEAGVLLHADAAGFCAKLFLLGGEMEGALRAVHCHNIPDSWMLKVLGTLNEWEDAENSPAPAVDYFDIARAFAPSIALIQNGYDMETLEHHSFDDLLYVESSYKPTSYDVPEPTDRRIADPGYWCIGQSIKGAKLYDLAFDYVKHGKKVLSGVPRFSCGKLTTVDRREIEAFNNIKNLITEYAATKNPPRPLSIAVFGAPGSGKSFGVKQIAKTLLQNVEALEVNVSQLTGVADLAAAFHRVRDTVLKGKLPLVFFDEFDSDKDGRALGWLKSFLAPMQDGEFKDENGVHPIGRCIMVFAGGTAVSFGKFVPLMSDGRFADFKDVKGPDFVSRLRGTIDIMGPNQVEGTADQGFILRRALLLRSFLEGRELTDSSGAAQVSGDILRAMLLIPKYEHGARSMEAILDMSRMDGASFEPVCLPFYTQMNLHVDAEAFIRLVLKDVILNGYLEALAEAIHEDYRAKQKERGLHINANVDMPWASLSEGYKNDNRRQAADIPRKLGLIGCAFDLGDAPFQSIESVSESEMELLAKEEHESWMEGKRKSGWTYGDVRDDANKKHPLLVPFGELPLDEKQKDVDSIVNMFKMFTDIGLRVYRIV